MKEKMRKCKEFFDALSEALKESYEVVASCNGDISAYLIPRGSIGSLSYYGKPERSFRISDHWNWYSSTRKCSDRTMVQCESVDMPKPVPRDSDRATKPKYGVQVAYYGADYKYHCVYGEVFDRERRKWLWREANVEDILEKLKE